MRDPFRSNAKSKLIKEAQVGLSLVAILFSLFVYVAFYKLTGRGQHLPEHVRNAPVATPVWPGAEPPREIEMSPQEFLASRNPANQARKPSVTEAGDPPSQQEMLAPREPAVGPMVESLTDSEPSTKITRNFPSFGDQLKNLLGGFEPEKNRIRTTPIKKSDLAPMTDMVASVPEVTSPVTISPAAVAKSSSQEPPLPTINNINRIDTPRELATDVKLASGESNDTDFSPFDPPPTTPSISEVDSNELNSFAPVVNQDFPSATESSVETVKSRSEFGDSKIVSPVSSALDLADGSWPTGDSQPILDAPKPVSHSPADPLARQLPKPTTQPVTHARLSDADLKNASAQIANFEPGFRPRDSLSYVSREGDSFWSIAQNVYQDGRYFRALYKYNQPTVPDFESLLPGTKIGTPSKQDLAKLWPDLCPAADVSAGQGASIGESTNDVTNRIYVTKAGDTLFDIARQKLGQAYLSGQIRQMNDVRLAPHINDLSPLREGMRLVLPAQ